MPADPKALKLLIDFFSTRSVPEAEAQEGKKKLLKDFGYKDWSELSADAGYVDNYDRVKQLRADLDKSLGGLSGLDQVMCCLALIKDKAEAGHKEEIDILTSLIKNQHPEGIYNNWNQDQQQHFEKAIPMLVEWDDFFFSYTTRNLPETNNEFTAFIEHSFNTEEYEKQKNDINYIAKLIVKYLSVKNLRPFFDLEKITCGDILGQKILDHCKSCYVFVQLLEEESFHLPSNKENWCHLEYEEFNKWVATQNVDAKRFYFLLTLDRDIIFPPDPLPKDYCSWIESVKLRKDAAVIMKLRNNLDLKRKTMEMAEEIKEAKKVILNPYLGDFAL